MKACPRHPATSLSVPCTRCGDFACPQCLESVPGTRVCAACIDRIEVPETFRLRAPPTAFPKTCPTCGQPATTPVTCSNRNDSTAIVVWPHCARCAADEASLQARRGQVFMVVVLGVVVLQLVLGLGAPPGPTFAVYAIFLAGAGLAYLRARRAPPPRPGAVAFGAGARLVSIEYGLPTLKRTLVVKILDPSYARVFAVLNESVIEPRSSPG